MLVGLQFPVFLVANIRGGLTTKLDELQLLFISNNVDICVISETWLHDGINSDILQIADYSLFRLDRRGGQQGGGLAVYVKQGISCSCLSQLTHNQLEVLWLLYCPHSMPREVTHLLIGAVYHPPKANNFKMLDYLVTSMDEFTRAHPYTGILLLGDFNQLPDSQLKSFPLQQIVTCPTRGNSILDKIYTNVTDWYQTPIILPGVSRSDHEAIHLKPAADPRRPSRSIRVFYRRLVSPNRKALLCDELKRVNWTPLFTMNSCQFMVNYFYSVMIDLLDRHMPVVRVSADNLNKPWVTKTFVDMIKQCQRPFLASQTSLYQKLRNKIKRMSISLRKNYYTRKVQVLHSADSCSWWQKTTILAF